MSRNVNFKDAFWVDDFCSSDGFDVLLNKVKDGTKTCKGIEDFLRMRAKAEEDFGKQLIKAGKHVSSITESGSIKEAWKDLIDQTTECGQDHISASQKIYDSANRIGAFLEKQKCERKKDEEQTKKSFKKKIELHKKTADSKKSYEKASDDLQIAKCHIEQMNQRKSEVPTKEYDKASKKHSKCVTDEKHAVQTYKQNIELLDKARVQWENDMINACDVFQLIEENRLIYLRNEIWAYTNVVSQTCVTDDNHTEKIRLALEKCNFNQDLEDFIERNQKGNIKPGPILFEEYKQSIR